MRSELSVKIQLVDDGSGADQQSWLRLWAGDLSQRFPILLSPMLLPANVGKGGAIYAGWQKAPAGTHWLAFVDADGAVSPEEVVRVLNSLTHTTDDALWSVRTGEHGTMIRRDWGRKFSGLVFRKLVRFLFHFSVPDTQCGFKIVRSESYQKIAHLLKEHRYCFDIELTGRLEQSGASIRSIPINWEESPGSRLGPKSVLTMIRSLFQLKRRIYGTR